METQYQSFEQHIKVEQTSQTAVDILEPTCPLSRQQIKQAMQKGCVWLTHGQYTRRLRRAKKKLPQGDELHIYYNPAVINQQPLIPQLIKDCGEYSVWYKPYGVFSQGSKWGDHCTINRLVEQQINRPAFIVNRLDRAATGLMIIAHKKTSAAALASLFKQRAITKRYRVIVHGKHPDLEQILDTDIHNLAALSKSVLLDYDTHKNRSLLEVSIETGRKHQIRIHLSEAGFAVVGDRLYGNGNDKEDLQLCSCYLEFECPLTRQTRRFTLNKPLQPVL